MFEIEWQVSGPDMWKAEIRGYTFTKRVLPGNILVYKAMKGETVIMNTGYTHIIKQIASHVQATGKFPAKEKY